MLLHFCRVAPKRRPRVCAWRVRGKSIADGSRENAHQRTIDGVLRLMRSSHASPTASAADLNGVVPHPTRRCASLIMHLQLYASVSIVKQNTPMGRFTEPDEIAQTRNYWRRPPGPLLAQVIVSPLSMASSWSVVLRDSVEKNVTRRRQCPSVQSTRGSGERPPGSGICTGPALDDPLRADGTRRNRIHANLVQCEITMAGSARPHQRGWARRQATTRCQSRTLIYGRAISASHARLAGRLVSRLARQLRNPLSAVLTARAQALCQLGIRKMPRPLLLLQST